MPALKFIKWGKVLDVTLAVAGIAIPLISGRRQEVKAEAEMSKKIREEVAKEFARRRHHG